MTDSRHRLLANMEALTRDGLDCSNCTGECCTSKYNSMMIGQEEAVLIVNYLRKSKLLTNDLVDRLTETISNFRLNVELPQAGSRPNLRRTYTCTFFNSGPKGCSLPAEVKPFGCLAFNPTKKLARGVAMGCASDSQFLPEVKSKWPIPVALLDVIKKSNPE